MKISRVFLATLCAAFSVAGLQDAQADIILQNTFDASIASGITTYSIGQTTDPNITSSGVTRPGYTLNGGPSGALVAGELRGYSGSLNPTQRYFGFDINPVGGAEVDFDDFTYVGFSTPAGGSTVDPTFFDFRWSTDGFATNSLVAGASLAGTTLDLSTVTGLQDVTTPVQFRLYIQSNAGTTGVSPDSTYSLDSFTFNGTATAAAVPEPSSVALFAVVGAGFVIRRRRKMVA